jgi:rubrerythrin
VGGRSRVAAQMLAGQGFNNVINMAGGFKAWNGEAAYGDASQGLELFSGNETPEKTLIIAYSLEQGLRDFYLAMASRIKNQAGRDLFKKMAAIEIKHQDRIFQQYLRFAPKAVDRETFERQTLADVVEGGLTTEEYIQRFHPDLESPTEIIALAMSIEAQALDLYRRAADRSGDPEGQKALRQIADEEQTHLAQLGKLMDSL